MTRLSDLPPDDRRRVAIAFRSGRQHSDPAQLEDTFAFQLKAARLPDPTREALFHPTRKWRFDFLWMPQQVAVEIEGGTWTAGRHVRPAAFEQDCTKYAEAAILGFRVLRVTGHMVEDGRALNLTQRALNAHTNGDPAA